MRTEQNNYALRLPTSLMRELKTAIKDEHTSINQFICLAVAEKLTALRTEDLLLERVKNYDKQKFLKALEKTGNNPPREGDELPE